MAAKSVAARRERKAALANLVLLPAPGPVASEKQNDGWLEQRLMCLRAQLALLDQAMLTERDAQKRSWIATAQARVAEQERIAAGRSLPPVIKAAQGKDRQRRGDILPL